MNWWQALGMTERKAPVHDGGHIMWWEHSLAWSAYRKQAVGPIPSSKLVAAAGGFTANELVIYLGRAPRTLHAQ